MREVSFLPYPMPPNTHTLTHIHTFSHTHTPGGEAQNRGAAETAAGRKAEEVTGRVFTLGKEETRRG